MGDLRVTTELRHEEILDIIGVDITKKDMVVLGALLKAQKEPGDFIDFETIREQMTKDEGSRKGKDPLIYRTLSKLEKGGFLRIDKGGQKHGYNSNVGMLKSALVKCVTSNLKRLESDLRKIDYEVTLFSEMDSDALAEGLIEFLSGAKKSEKPIFAQGWDDIVKLLDDKIWSGVKKGDVVRINLEWISQIDYLKPKRVLNIERALKKGVKLRALDHDRGEKAFRESMKSLLARMKSTGGDIEYRVYPRNDATYQFLSKNSEGVVLIVSEKPLSATWLPRSGNVELVDHAIESFDKDFKQGFDLLEYEG
jgi:Fe2+ or Zn2+ uptake regulation protein